MQLFNTLTKQVEPFTALDAPHVTVYTCGPTVYDYPHIGNWFTFIRYDLLIRTLKLSGFKPTWVMNITDVGHLVSDADDGEDKLEKGARREGKTAWDVAKMYGDYFVQKLDELNFSRPDYLPKATEHITEQIELIQMLESAGYTYLIHDGVYFDTSKFLRYADFAQLDLDEQQAGARVEQNPQKRQQNDFALWKLSPSDQQRDMEWDSPWGKGFPGWHIECSAMSRKYLGDTIDIHSGGIDHIPVHHTNEIAQSEAATGKQFARYWMHTNHILINDEKISKSTGNGIILEELEKRGLSLAAFRLHVLESHYRSQSKFSWESLQAAQNRLRNYQALADLRFQDIPGALNDRFSSQIEDVLPKQIKDALEEDLNTPKVLTALSVAEAELSELYTNEARELLIQFLQTYVDDALGLNLLKSMDISSEQKALINERIAARQQKNWARSDEIRDSLEQQGIGLKDAGETTIWVRL